MISDFYEHLANPEREPTRHVPTRLSNGDKAKPQVGYEHLVHARELFETYPWMAHGGLEGSQAPQQDVKSSRLHP